MTKNMTREQALETLRGAFSHIETAWNSEDPGEKQKLLLFARQHLGKEIDRLEEPADYTTPAPAPVDLYFLSPHFVKGEDDNFIELIWDVMDEYDVPVTNNEPRWQDGRWLREAGAFVGHIKDAVHVSGEYVTRREHAVVQRIADDAVEVANAEKQKRIELELELEMWQKGYRK